METSLRFGDSSKALLVHAKEKIPIDNNTHFMVRAACDTGTEAAHYFSAMIRHFYPNMCGTLGIGLQYKNNEKLRYCLQVKKEFPIKEGSFNMVLKGNYNANKEFSHMKYRGAAEAEWNILDFIQDQDIRLKVGYELFDKVPYFQVRENNWALGFDISGRWNCRYYL